MFSGKHNPQNLSGISDIPQKINKPAFIEPSDYKMVDDDHQIRDESDEEVGDIACLFQLTSLKDTWDDLVQS